MIAGHGAPSSQPVQHSCLLHSRSPKPSYGRCRSLKAATTVQAQQHHANKLAPLRPDEVWYFAYGSNMNTKTLTGRRMVRPRQSVPCMVPDHTLSFGVLGFPYTEPGFATIVQSTQQQQQQPAANPPGSVGRMTLKQEHSAEEQSRGHRPCVHGVLHRITKREWAFVQATEGAGNRDVGYQVTSVTCLLYDGKTVVQAQTLKSAASSMHTSERRVSPSQRYLRLLQEGAQQHQLDPAYQRWLACLQAYQSPGVLQQALGTMASGAVMAAAAAPAVPVYVAGRALGLLPQPEPAGDVAGVQGTEAGSCTTSSSRAKNDQAQGVSDAVPFLSWYAIQAQSVTWWVHDNVISSVLGSGCGNDDDDDDVYNRLQ